MEISPLIQLSMNSYEFSTQSNLITALKYVADSNELWAITSDANFLCYKMYESIYLIKLNLAN
jgi:hypothetical protein